MARHFLKPYATLIGFVTRVVDLVIIFLAAYIAHALIFGHFAPLPQHYLIATFLGLFIAFFYLNIVKVYLPIRVINLYKYFSLVTLAWTLIAVSLAFLAFLTKTGNWFSRLWFIYWLSLSYALSILVRIIAVSFLRFIRNRGHNLRRIVIIGTRPNAEHLLSILFDAKGSGYAVAAIMTDEDVPAHTTVQQVPIQSISNNLEQYIQENDIDEIWIAMQVGDMKKLDHILGELRFSTANIKLVPYITKLHLLNHSVSELAGMPILHLRNTPMEGGNKWLKSLEDKILALFILLLISPILLLLTLAIKLTSRGQVFYRQERVSWNNKKFKMIKFRTMPADAENKSGPVWAKQGESRATIVGGFLRKTSLDELPQFWNVLKGDMSIVGPRPERPIFVEQFKQEVPGYMQKHMVKAGITGWAQIHGWRGDTNLAKRIEYDLYYIENWSLWFDIKIIFMTLYKGFFHKNAY